MEVRKLERSARAHQLDDPDALEGTTGAAIPGPVNPGDTWDANDGVVSIEFRLIGTSVMNGREVAEVYSMESSYTGPIKHWVAAAT